MSKALDHTTDFRSVARSFVPRPVYAVLQLFPVTDSYEKDRKARDEQAKNEDIPQDMLFFKQTVSISGFVLKRFYPLTWDICLCTTFSHPC